MCRLLLLFITKASVKNYSLPRICVAIQTPDVFPTIQHILLPFVDSARDATGFEKLIIYNLQNINYILQRIFVRKLHKYVYEGIW